MLDEARGHLGYVHKAVLVHADVHEGAEVDHVAYGARELHAHLEVVDAAGGAAEHDLGRVVTRVTAGLLELRDDVEEREDAAADLGCQGRHAAHALLDVGDAARREVRCAHARRA